MPVFALADEAATVRLANELAAGLGSNRSGWMVLLQGELGAGKSTLARAMLKRFGHEGTVPSPTYTLVEPYELADGAVFHIDLYRINGLEELEYLGWNDLRDGLILLEWPERAPEVFGQADIHVHLAYAGEAREARIEALSARAQELVAAISPAAICGD